MVKIRAATLDSRVRSGGFLCRRRSRAAVQIFAQEASGVRTLGGFDHFHRCAAGDQLTALGAALGAEIDDVVGVFDDVEVVLNGDDRVAHVDQAMEDADQFFDVEEVQPGGRLVQDVERRAAGFLAEFVGEFDPLGFAAGERVACLAEIDIPHADVVEHFQRPGDFGKGVEERHRLFDGHAKHVEDIFVVVTNVERLFVETLAVAGVAVDEDIGKKTHLFANLALAGALLAAAAFDVEGKTAGGVTAQARFRRRA